MDTTPVFHVAFVVEDIDEASAAWGQAIGVRFGKLQTPSLVWGTPEGKRELICNFVYSINGPPYIELVERRDDSFWEEVGFHHLGVWSNDVALDSERLTSIGAEWSCAVLNTAGVRTGGCMHTIIDDARVELVSKPISLSRLARYVSGGDWWEPIS